MARLLEEHLLQWMRRVDADMADLARQAPDSALRLPEGGLLVDISLKDH